VIRHGEPPYLECSSRGDRRFSAFYARPSFLDGRSIEQAYQAMKRFDDGTTGLSPRDAKRKQRTSAVVNMDECREAYSLMWDGYVKENPDLLGVLRAASGLSDMFGQAGHACQATELWRIRNLPRREGCQGSFMCYDCEQTYDGLACPRCCRV